VGETGKVKWDEEGHRFYAIFPGKPSGALRRAAPDLAFPWGDDPQFYHQERWFEVYLDKNDGHIDVITRIADEFVNAVADGFANLCARVWEGTREE